MSLSRRRLASEKQQKKLAAPQPKVEDTKQEEPKSKEPTKPQKKG